MPQLIEFLRKVYLFESLPNDELTWLSEVGRLREFSAGETVFFEGQPAGSLFLIRQGTIELKVRGSDDAQSVALLGPGSMLGEMGMVSASGRSATAIVRENSTVVEFSYSDIESRAASDLRFGMHLYRAMAGQLAKRISATTHSLAAVKELKLRNS